MTDDDVPELPIDDEPDPGTEQTVSAADPAGLAQQQRRVKREEREAADFWRGVLATEVGRRELWPLVKQAFETTFATGPNGFPQPEATWFHAGAHERAMRLYHSLQIIDHAAVFQMLREHDSRFKSRDPARRRRKREVA